MDGSIGTLDIGGLRDEDADDSQDELEGDEERQRELKDILSTAFEDMSSIDDEDEENSAEFRSLDSRPNRSLLNVRKKFFSTPNDNNNVLRGRPHANISVIEEEPAASIHSQTSGRDSVDLKSVEKCREAELQNESYHIRLLLDQNKKLCSERTKLQQLCDSVTGDFEGLSYKCQRLEDVLSEKEKLVDQLMGKLAALQISLQSGKEVQSEAKNKLLIAESTISSLRNELKEMHEADGMERIRVLYESQLKQLQNKYETERSGWTDERETLNEKIDEQKHQISKLKIELELRLKKAASERKSPTHSDNNRNKKLESDLQSVRQNCHQLESRVSQLQTSLQEAQTQLSATRNALSVKSEESEQLSQELEAKDRQIQSQESEITKLNEQVKQMSDSLKDLEQRMTADKTREETSERTLRSKMEQEVIRQVKQYRDEIEGKFHAEFMSKLREMRDAYAKQEEQLERSVIRICSWIEGLAGQGVKPQECELYTVFDPVINIWSAVEKKMDEQLSKLSDKKKEIQDAKQELEDAYVHSKSDPNDGENALLDAVHEELNEAKEQINALKEKADRYKKHYAHLVNKFASEREQLKCDYKALVRNQISDVCKNRENQLTSLLSRDSRLLLQQINQAYSDSLKNMKEQHDRFLEQSSGKSLQNMADAIVTYHEIVTKKITQRSQHLVRQINETFCEGDAGDGSFIRRDSAALSPH